MSHWNYRVFRRRLDGDEEELTIREAYYDDAGKLNGWTDEAAPHGANLDELRVDLQRMLDCLAKPVVDE